MIRRLIAILKERRRAKSVDYYFININRVNYGIMDQILKKTKMPRNCTVFLFTASLDGNTLTIFHID